MSDTTVDNIGEMECEASNETSALAAAASSNGESQVEPQQFKPHSGASSPVIGHPGTGI